MTETTPSSDFTLLSSVLIVAAMIATVAMWGRFVSVATSNPSPPRFVDVTVNGEAPEGQYRLFCFHEPVSVDGIVWRNCLYEDNLGTEDFTESAVQIRYDFANGRAQVDWFLEGIDPISTTDAFMILPDGSFVLSKNGFQLFHLLPEGETLLLYTFDQDEQVAGLGYIEEGGEVSMVEMVTVNFEEADSATPVTIHTVSLNDGEATTRELPLLDCADDEICRLELAYMEDNIWHLVYSRASVEIPPDEVVTVEVFTIPEDSEGEITHTQTLELLEGENFTINDDGQFQWLGVLPLVRSGSNEINTIFTGRPFEWVDDSWRQLETPFDPLTPRSINSVYVFRDQVLTWEPQLENLSGDLYLQRLDDRWVSVFLNNGNIQLTDVDSDGFEVVSPWNALFFEYHSFMPAADGGYWLQESPYRYVKLNENLAREDPLTFSERLARLMGDYHENDSIGSTLQENGFVKQASIPLMLLFMPLGIVLVGVGARLVGAVGYRRRLILWAGALSLVYVLLVLFLRVEFWVFLREF